MAIVPTNLARVSNLLRTSVAVSSMTRTQRMLLDVQNQLTTGQRLNTPSDDPGDSAVVLQLQKTLEQRSGYLDNIASAKNTLSSVDTSLDGLTGILRQAQQIASANVGSDVTADARASAAAIIDNIFSQAMTYGNSQFNGTYLFGGDRSNTAPFEASPTGGVKFVGSNDVLQNTFDDNTVLPFMVSAEDVFGSLSDQRVGSGDLSPALTTTTRLADLAGTTGEGVAKGIITIANGSATANVDLSGADTIADVIAQINAVSATTDVTASIAPDGNSLLLTPGSGSVAVTEVGGGTTARDLGILQPTGVAPLDGVDVQPKVTPLTPLADLLNGAGLDPAGFVITNGTTSATITPAGLTTVEDLLNRINSSPVNVKATINTNGTGLDIVNPVQGTDMTIGENGGTTATQFGLRTMSGGTTTTEINGGVGMRTQPGADITITRQDGTSFSVDLDGLPLINDVINAINAAAGTTMASFTAVGNGIELTDGTTGTGTFRVETANFSSAGVDLGLVGQPSVAGVITGKDVNPVSSDGVYSSLGDLRDALRGNDQQAITRAATALEKDLARVSRVRGIVGARVQELEGREERITDENVSTQALLSRLKDVDYTAAITKFSTLQTSLQATLQTTAQVTNLSLLDFLA
jgi:flagellar hook-associated protein 3 FlgL